MKSKVLAPEIEIVREKVYAPVVVTYYSRVGINEKIQEYMRRDRAQEVILLYVRETKSYEVAYLLITTALKYEVPVNVVFAIVKQESGFNTKALGPHKEVGLMQLLPRSFSKYKSSSLYEPRLNIELGVKHLLEKKAKGRGTLEEGIMRYNGNSEAGFDYMTRILKWEREFDRKFNEAIWEIEYESTVYKNTPRRKITYEGS